MQTKVILIRHGQTDWNRQRRYQGSADIPLNDQGRDEARKLKAWVSGRKIDSVFSSDRKRASEFARIAFGDFCIKEDPGFREMGFGVFEGLVYEEAMRKFSGIYSGWISDPANTVIPGAETLSSFRSRVLSALDRVTADNSERAVAIVTHAGPIRMILDRIIRPECIWDLKADSGSIHVVETENGKGRVLVLNDTSYLRDG